MPAPKIGTLAVLGLGLIGGSVAAAARQRGLAQAVVGFAPHGDAEQALALGLIDACADSVSAAVGQADAVVIAVPVPAIESVLAEVADSLLPHAWLTDCCSTKVSVVTAATRLLTADQLERYVPGHPIAGSEHSGPKAARANLFDGKAWLISEYSPVRSDCIASVESFVAALGARVGRAEPQEHDAMFAEYSHMPHALVFALCHALARGPHAARLGELAGAGFRDTSRIGASSPSLWTDILLDNRAEVERSLNRLQDSIDLFKQMISRAERDRLFNEIERAAAWRSSLD